VKSNQLKPWPHCRRKLRLSPFSCRFRRQSLVSATVSLFCDSVDRALDRQAMLTSCFSVVAYKTVSSILTCDLVLSAVHFSDEQRQTNWN